MLLVCRAACSCCREEERAVRSLLLPPCCCCCKEKREGAVGGGQIKEGEKEECAMEMDDGSDLICKGAARLGGSCAVERERDVLRL